MNYTAQQMSILAICSKHPDRDHKFDGSNGLRALVTQGILEEPFAGLYRLTEDMRSDSRTEACATWVSRCPVCELDNTVERDSFEMFDLSPPTATWAMYVSCADVRCLHCAYNYVATLPEVEDR